MAKKPGAQATVTLKHLAANLSESHEMSKKQTEAVLGDLVGLVTKHLKKGDRIRIGGLGILVVRKRAARMGRNPGDWRTHPDQGQQKGGLPSRQGTQGSGVTHRRSNGRQTTEGACRIPSSVSRAAMDLAALPRSNRCAKTGGR